ncbi:MAG TPA: TrmH family RNA methyltransferase [Bacteroidales bacterium]|nr:TrmH family RNA methyltransferase [Bacteroidales bacterium]
MVNNKKIFDYLSGFLTEHRKKIFYRVIANRTRHLTVVLEDIYQPQNASAVLRSCDCFGIQDVHVIENQNEYKINPDVALGAQKWLNLYRYNNTAVDNTKVCFQHLKAQGYKIIATTPHQSDITINDLPVNEKTAIVFGQELRGLSQNSIAMADGFVRIPMYGFTESFNISVSAAIVLKILTDKIRSEKIRWQLSQEEQKEILLQWTRKSIKKVELIEKNFLDQVNKK